MGELSAASTISARSSTSIGLGQSQPTMLQWNLEIYKARWEAFGWQALLVDGHSIPDLIAAFETADPGDRSSDDRARADTEGQGAARH